MMGVSVKTVLLHLLLADVLRGPAFGKGRMSLGETYEQEPIELAASDVWFPELTVLVASRSFDLASMATSWSSKVPAWALSCPLRVSPWFSLEQLDLAVWVASRSLEVPG